MVCVFAHVFAEKSIAFCSFVNDFLLILFLLFFYLYTRMGGAGFVLDLCTPPFFFTCKYVTYVHFVSVLPHDCMSFSSS